jgi:hypothetical protein
LAESPGYNLPCGSVIASELLKACKGTVADGQAGHYFF